MNNQTMLKRLLDIQIGNGSYMDFSKFLNLISDLEADIREENNKARGCGNLNKLAKAIFKSAPPASKMMQYAKIDNGVQFILDGYRIVGFYEPLDLPDYDACKDKDNLPPEWFKISHILEATEYDDEKPLQMPTVAELKAEIKIAKSKSKSKGLRFMWKFENGPAVNAQFLLDFMEGFPDMKIYASENKPMANPLYMEAEKGMGILLPIKCDEDIATGLHTI